MNNLISKKDGNNNETKYKYDNSGRLVKTIDALGNETSFEYDGEGRLTKTRDPRGNSISMTYDAAGRVIAVTDGAGNTTEIEYDVSGNVVVTKDANGKVVINNEYDSLIRLVKQTDALGRASSFEYDALGNIVKSINPNEKENTLSYDKLGRLVKVVDAINGVSEQVYDNEGNLRQVKDPNNNTVTYSYDLANRLTSEEYTSGRKLFYQYDLNNNLTKSINGRKQETTLSYYASGAVKAISYVEETVTYTYDGNYNVTEISDKSGKITRKYDALNRVIEYKDAEGNVIGYEYDSVGNLTKLIYPGGKAVSYQYDSRNLLTKVTDWAGRVTTYEYDKNQNLIKTTKPEGSTEVREYNDASELTALIIKDKSGKVIDEYHFTYDTNGNVQTESRSNGVDPTSLMDATMTYGADNRLETFNGQAVKYDADGNMIKGPISNSGAMVDFQYDSRNRLIKAGTTTYTYDAENIRKSVTVDGKTTKYVVNPHTTLSQLLIKKNPDGSQTFYVYGIGLISEESSAGAYKVYHFDRRGSTTALTDSTGKVTDRFSYGPYGELISRSGSSDTPFLYNGRDGVMTDQNGLYYMRARYYNPTIKRFINMDVVIGSVVDGRTLNRYAYVNGNPISYIDPFGLSADEDRPFWLRALHTVLDILGFIPGIGDVFDVVNGAIYLFEGDYVNAALSFTAVIPIVGSAIVQGGKCLYKGIKYGVETLDKSRFLFKHADEFGNMFRGMLKYGDEALALADGGFIKYGDDAAEFMGTSFIKYGDDAADALSDGHRAISKGTRSTVGKLTGSLDGLTSAERKVVNDLLSQGKNVEIIPRSNVQGVSTPDFIINGVKTELKTLNGTSLNTPVTRITDAFKQGADAVIIDARNVGITAEQANQILNRAAGTYQNKVLPGQVEIWTVDGIIRR